MKRLNRFQHQLLPVCERLAEGHPRSWVQTLLAAPCHIDEFMAVTWSRANVSTRVTVVLETSAWVYQHRVPITQLLFNICNRQRQTDKQTLVHSTLQYTGTIVLCDLVRHFHVPHFSQPLTFLVWQFWVGHFLLYLVQKSPGLVSPAKNSLKCWGNVCDLKRTFGYWPTLGYSYPFMQLITQPAGGVCNSLSPR